MTIRARTVRNVAVAVLLLLGTALVLALVSNESRRGYLDPEGVDQQGAGALVQLLEDQGVEVTDVRTSTEVANAAEPGTTLLIAVPDAVGPHVDTLVETGADIVLVAPTFVIMSEFSDRIGFAGGNTGDAGAFVESRDPECSLPAAQRAGSAHLGNIAYTAEEPAVGCYPASEDTASLVVDTTAEGGRLVVLGTAQPLVNRYLDEDGNAALAMNLLGRNQELIWYRPTLEEIDAAETSPAELFPDWVAPVAWQLAIAALLAALWQARRLGRVVPERLPVVVRAAETTEGLARLYRRGRSRGHAAATLRESATGKLRTRLGLPRSADARTVATAAAARTGRSENDVVSLLAGPAPSDEPALVRLADELDALIEEVIAR